MPQFYNILLYGRLTGQVTLNTFWYASQDTLLASASEFGEAWIEYFKDFIPQAAGNVMLYERIVVQEWNNDTNFATIPLTASEWTGDIGGTSFIDYQCIPFICGSRRRGIKAGSRRLAGVTDAMCNTSGVWNNTFLTTTLEPLADAFSTNIEVPIPAMGDAPYAPVIVRHVPVLTGGKVYYKPPATIGTSDYYLADQWRVKPQFSHQLSRQVPT